MKLYILTLFFVEIILNRVENYSSTQNYLFSMAVKIAPYRIFDGAILDHGLHLLFISVQPLLTGVDTGEKISHVLKFLQKKSCLKYVLGPK